MKLRFEPDLDFQRQAVEAICGLFRGQEVCRTEFTVTRDATHLPFDETGLGIGNRLTLVDDEILENLRDTQLHNGLPQSGSLESGDFTVEMETGTGKTYVYLRTAFVLNKRYGFPKFVVVVPSVAIKAGVYKSLQLTDDDFQSLYAGVPFEYFLYDSAKLGQVRNFATSPQIQIAAATVEDAHNKPCVRVVSTSHRRGVISATVELDVENGGRVRRTERTRRWRCETRRLATKSPPVWGAYVVCTTSGVESVTRRSSTACHEPIRATYRADTSRPVGCQHPIRRPLRLDAALGLRRANPGKPLPLSETRRRGESQPAAGRRERQALPR